MDSTPRTPQPNPFLTPRGSYPDVMLRYRDTCPRCSGPVSSFKIEHQGGRIIYTVECNAGHRTTA